MKSNLNHAGVLALVVSCMLAGCGGSPEPRPPIWQPESNIPMNGTDTPDNARVDAQITALMKKYNVPGMSVAIAKNGILIFARGYGYADMETRQEMQPDARGRLGSIAKTITSAALLHLAEEGKVDLDAPFLDVLTQYTLPANADPRLRGVTVRQILWHTGGWDADMSGDIVTQTTQIASQLGVNAPATCDDWIRYKMDKPLDFTPGTKFKYSNFGYCIISAIVEKVSNRNYYDYVRDNVLASMQIRGMEMGHTLESQRLANEVKYYDFPGDGTVPSVFPPHDQVSAPYGFVHIEGLKGIGGWIGSAIDLTRFFNHLDGARSPLFLVPDSVAEFTARPQISGFESASGWYGLGVSVEQTSKGESWNHNGGCPGFYATVNHRPDGYDWGVVVNTRPRDGNGFAAELWRVISELLDAGVTGSGTDLYEQFPSK